MIILTAVAGTLISLAPLFVSMKDREAVCCGVEVTVADSSRHRLITEDDIMNAIRATGIRVTGVKVNEIPLTVIEDKVRAFTELEEAEVFLTGNKTLHVRTDQREPVLRVVASYGGDFFIDSEGVIMRRHNLYTPNIHILEADMVFNASQMNGMNIYDSEKTANLARAFELVNYIRGHSFWNNMIDQLSMTRDGRVTLVPHVGNHTVMLGRTDDYKEKLNNLHVFYREAMPLAGWDKYRVVNIEYKGQVVCQRR